MPRTPKHHLQALFVLFESASGFALFEAKLDDIGQATEKVQASIR